MKIAKPTKALVTVAMGLVVAALIWPSTVDRWFSGWNPKAQAVRSHLPASIAGMLPDQPKPSASAQTASGGAPNAAGGRGSAGGANRPPASVRVATAQRGPQAVRAEAVGTVQPIASVAIRSRVDAQIESIQVSDGAAVKAGDVLVKLDSRQIEAQIKQAEAALARNQALLEQAERDVRRFAELVSKQTGTQVNLDNARTSVASSRAAILGDEAQIENLKVQLGWYTIRAPIPGRVGTFSQKAGNIIRSGDGTATGTLTTIVQTTPIYVAFSLPQRYLSDLRNAMSAQDSEVLATPQGATSPMKGRIAVIDNAIDSATGTLTVRAVFDNPDEILWSGQLCSVRVVLRTEPDAVSVPREAILIGQSGNYVYVVENGVARVRPVTIGRSQDGRDIIQTGLKGGESVVIDGSLNLQNGSRVEVRSVEARKVAD
ncbi:MAG: efflux RND transporter periplasmic adaptor subunit [Beijerinckiaceae bacterium]|nr:efflux RND transporter periplasmic adaptor subunit [Beijerinckiaceae bacterium]